VLNHLHRSLIVIDDVWRISRILRQIVLVIRQQLQSRLRVARMEVSG